MNLLLLPVSIMIGVLGGSANNYFSKQYMRGARQGFSFSACAAVVSACLLLALTRSFALPSRYTLALGALYGTVTALGQLMNLLALSKGPFSLTVMLGTGSMPVTTLICALFWREAVSLPQWLGVAMMAAALVLCAGGARGRPGEKSANLPWLLLCAGNVLCTVSVGILQKVHQFSPYKGELDAFLVVSFFVGAGAMTLLSLTAKRGETGGQPPRLGILAAAALVSGLSAGAINKINMYLVGVMPSVVFFPVNNGGTVLLSAAVSVTVFREKLAKRQVAAFALGLAAIALIGKMLG